MYLTYYEIRIRKSSSRGLPAAADRRRPSGRQGGPACIIIKRLLIVIINTYIIKYHIL